MGKAFIVEEAELMNAAAQNALLKTLEEPYGRTLIILLTDQPNSLLQTIRSRCQMVRFASLDRSLVERELIARKIDPAMARDAAIIAEGSLGLSLRYIEDDIISRLLSDGVVWYNLVMRPRSPLYKVYLLLATIGAGVAVYYAFKYIDLLNRSANP
jgi:hypothetical protein